MAPPLHLIHSASSIEEASALWWPLIRDLGWNRSSEDGHMHLHAAIDGKTWLLITPDSEEKPQGCVVALPYPNSTGWIGFFVMNEVYRGKGLGGALWRAMEKTFQEYKTNIIGLDGVEEQVPTYTRRGFVDTSRIPVMQCTPAAVQKAITSPDEEGTTHDIRITPRSYLAAIDLAHTGLDRSIYWLTSPLLTRSDTFGYTYSPTPTSPLTSLILIRSCTDGHRIGPLYASSPAIATHLLRRAMQHPSIATSSGSLVAEVFGANPDAKQVFEELGWTGVGVEYHRMWFGGRVPQEQREGGKGVKGMFAVFDAGCG
jgi:GNAT superfamily N-acetyltransferase